MTAEYCGGPDRRLSVSFRVLDICCLPLGAGELWYTGFRSGIYRIFVIPGSLGLVQLTTGEVAQDKFLDWKYLANIKMMKVARAAITFVPIALTTKSHALS